MGGGGRKAWLWKKPGPGSQWGKGPWRLVAKSKPENQIASARVEGWNSSMGASEMVIEVCGVTVLLTRYLYVKSAFFTKMVISFVLLS